MASTCLKYDVCLVVAHFAAECAHPVFFIHENNEEGCTLEVYNKITELKKKSNEIFIHIICCEFYWKKNIIESKFLPVNKNCHLWWATIKKRDFSHKIKKPDIPDLPENTRNPIFI